MHDVPKNHQRYPFLDFLTRINRFSVRMLAVIMTAVILWGVVDVLYVLYDKLMEPPIFVLGISDILATFGAFMAVLIAIEIFVNITLYLREEVIHVRIVMATALMAIARKVIILDYDEVNWQEVLATAAVVAAMSFGYWITTLRGGGTAGEEVHNG